jgi:hypothetical protein
MSVIWLIRDLYLVKILPLITGNYRRFFPVLVETFEIPRRAPYRFLDTPKE